MDRSELISKLERLQDGNPTSFESGIVMILIDGIIYKQGSQETISLEELKCLNDHGTNLLIHMCDEDPICLEIEKILSD